ncbi:MAG: c-type cytochrome [Candidatus Binatia bacterium]
MIDSRLSSRRWHTRLAPLPLAVLLAGGLAQRAVAADTIPPAVMTEAENIYRGRCISCHGPGGKGDGAAAAALNPKPRDMTDAAWQTSVTDAHIEQIIEGGGPAVGKSMMMPANPDLKSRPELIKALRAVVRQFGS